MFETKYKAAVVQMNSQTRLDQNLDQAYIYIKAAVDQGARIVGLPENFAFLGGLSMRIEHGDTIAEETSVFLSETAREFSIYLMGGSYPVPASVNKVYNRSTLYDPDGKELIHYDKIHLFDVSLERDETYNESAYVEAGKAEPAVYADDTIGGWGLSVCYDLRFPEYYRALVDRGAEILSIPSAFTYTTGRDHWSPLLRARAIENTSYVFAPAQTGLHGSNRETWGHAMIVDPWGEVIADAGSEPGIVCATIDPARIREVRRSIPSLNHRRLK
ncbi:Predicted amidohydrolase [Fodinibius roseus]|uniref:Predicted amidohydrolase n=1 Tax=Fodinibius roseus TaxID=1194090 RepID=A0A1M4TVK1_9BACT|nr:carbon-nitrogen hydrolase family protein [Fodinibius roseus]SHE48509.1 Predicted amidohydrolase [Fodinibius roseus]